MNTSLLISFLFAICASAGAKIQHANELSKILSQERFEINLGPIEDLIAEVIAILEVYDPILIENHSISFKEYEASVSNVHVHSFSKIVPKVSAAVGFLSTDINIHLSLSKFSASVESWSSIFPIVFGSGSARLEIDNMQLSVKANFHYIDGLQPCKVVASLDNVIAEITGIQNDPELSNMISNTIQTGIHTVVHHPEVHKNLGKVLDKVLAKVIG